MELMKKMISLRSFSFYSVLCILAMSSVITLSCAKTVEVKTVESKVLRVESTVSTVSSGTVDAEQQAILSFGGPGKVERIYVKLGDLVKAGQKIANIENKDAQAIFDQVFADYETSKKLMAEGLISRSALDEAKKAFEVAKSNLDKTIMIAPFAGMVSELNLQIGEVPATATAMNNKVAARVVDLKPRIIKGNIDEIDLPKVKVGAVARVRIQSVQAAPIEARVSRVIPYISTSKEQERTAQVELTPLDSKVLLPAGASADIEIVVAEKSEALAIPARAVFGVSGKRYVYRVNGNKLEKVMVETGLGNYEVIEITKGISAGESFAVATDSVELSDGQRIKAEKVSWPSSK